MKKIEKLCFLKFHLMLFTCLHLTSVITEIPVISHLAFWYFKVFQIEIIK